MVYNHKEYQKEWRQTHKEQITESNKKWRDTHREEINKKARDQYNSDANYRKLRSQWRVEYYSLPENKEKKNAQGAEYYQKNKEEILAKGRQRYNENKPKEQLRSRKRRFVLKIEVLAHYSEYDEPICACCGEHEIEFLSIDHINGGGLKERKKLGRSGWSFYLWLKSNKFPDGYRVLCHNCNQSYGQFGYCPHQLSEGEE